MATARDIIKSALRKIGAYGAGDTIPSAESAEALSTLNQMLSSWSAEGAPIFTETRENFTLTASQTSHTIGSGGDLNTTRPIEITSAFIRSGNIDFPLKSMDKDFYSRIENKSLTTNLPERYYYDANYPLGNIFLWPVQSVAAELHITSYKPLSTLTLSTTLAYPEGYERAIIYNLAVELAPDYGKMLPPEVLNTAYEAKQTIESANLRNDENLMSMDSMLQGRGGYNVYTDR